MPAVDAGVIEAATNLGVFSAGALALGWVARYGIKSFFDTEVKKYQLELEKERIQFSELHDRRAEVTAELYQRFVKLEEDMRSMTHPMEMASDPPKDELMESAAESGNEFINFYMRNKIYLPPEVCETVEDLHEEMRGVFNAWTVHKPHEERPGENVDPEKWLELWNTVTEDEVPELKTELESHFRKLLGVGVETR